MSEVISVYVGSKGKGPLECGALGFTNAMVSAALFGQGVYIDEDGNLKPGYIKSWSADSNESKISLTVNSEMQFSNGRNLDAYDLEFLIQSQVASEKSLHGKLRFGNIRGIENLEVGISPISGSVSGIKVLSATTLELYLKEFDPYFIYNFASPLPMMQPKENLQSDLFHQKGTPVTLGQYKVEKIDLENKSILVKPRIPGNDLKPLLLQNHIKPENSDIFIHSYAPKDVDESIFASQVSQSIVGNCNMIFHYESEKVQDINLRKAIYFGINKEKLFPSHDYLSTRKEVLSSDKLKESNHNSVYNLSLAKELSQKIQKDEHKNLTLLVGRNLFKNEVFKSEIQKQFLDIDLRLDIKEHNSEQESIKAPDLKFDLMILNEAIYFKDPLYTFKRFQYGFNFVKIPDKGYQVLLIKAEQANHENRVQFINELSNYFIEQALTIPLYETKAKFYYRKSKIKNLGKSFDVYPDYSKIEFVK